MENWQAFVPATGAHARQPAVAVAGSDGSQERARILNLIDFLAEYDALHNPPVSDISTYGGFLLRGTGHPNGTGHPDGTGLPGMPGTSLVPAGDAWLTAGFVDPAQRQEAPAARQVHQDLFRLWEQLAAGQEPAELVWGFGRLRWLRDGVLVDHPLICVPAGVELDEATLAIRVWPAGPPQVETRFLAGLTLADRAGLMRIRQEVSEAGADPWDAQALHSLLWSLIRVIDQDGTVDHEGTGAVDHEGTGAGQDRPPAAGAPAVADGSWVLFMRHRQADYQGFLARMRALYADQPTAVPGPLRAAVSDPPPAPPGPVPGASGRVDGPAGPLLLPLPASEEQQQILSQAQHRTGVSVHAPPGTGPSHAIANIISHYLACRKRVLVVAGKEQALRALSGKIPAGIRDLTVCLPGPDAAGQRELEQVAGQIRARVTAIDKAVTDQRIRQLTDDLDATDGTIAGITQALLASREAEIERLPGRWAAGETPTRAEAARWVAAHLPRLCYIDDLLTPATACPLTAAQLAELTALIGQVGAERAEACGYDLPDVTVVPATADLAGHFAQLAKLQASVRSLGDAVHDWGRAAACGRDVLQALAARCRAEMEWMAKNAGTWLGRVQDQAGDPLLARDWRSFGTQLSRDRQDVLDLRAALTAYRVVIPEPAGPSLAEGLQQARERLAEAGKLGVFAAPAKRAVQACEVDGRPPATPAEIDLCLQAVTLENLRWRIRTSWRNQVARVGGAELDPGVPEDVLGHALGDLDRVLGWPQAWKRLRAELAAAGVGSPPAADPNTLERLAEVCTRACDQFLLHGLSRWVRGLGEWLQAGAQPAAASPLWGLFADALSRQDLAQWQHLREELASLQDIAPAAKRLRDLRSRLASCAPIWTSRILADPAAARDPADLDAAWQWRQLDTWVREDFGGRTPTQLQARLEGLAQDRRRVIAELVSERAWRWLADVPAARNGSADAIPVWIMPAARALTSLRPAADPPFDLLVVAGAAQLGPAALPLLALAGTAIVVGDDQQASPDTTGLDREQVSGLLDQHLAMIPGYRRLFGPDASLYDVACQKFPGAVMLTEHFRCLPPIIAFANTHAYGDQLVPLRDQPPRPGWSALGAVKVSGGYCDGTVNEPEADAVAGLIAELCASGDYDGMDMGVVSLAGSSQSALIWEKLYDRLGPAVMRQRRLRCGEPASFQGDARDVIVISTVAAAHPAVPSGHIAPMTGHAATRHITVATSSARQQLWLVHSADPGVFPDDDLRGALIRHCRGAGRAPAPAASPLDACEPGLERDVLGKILARGYPVVSVQHPAGRYRIGIVVEGPHSRLAVECDSDRWQGPDAWRRDLARQQALGRAGWTFERIRGSAFYSDPDTTLLPLWWRLAELGIPTGDWRAAHTQQATVRDVDGAGLPGAPDGAGPGAPDGAAGVSLLPYQAWAPRPLPHPGTAPVPEVIAGLQEIVSAEGPVQAGRAYQLYAGAAGEPGAGPDLRRILRDATREALRTGVLRQLDDQASDLDEQTLYLPGRPSVLVRELGPRQLPEVPRGEVGKLIRYLGLPDAAGDVARRALLRAYGLVQLTERARQHLDECLSLAAGRAAKP